MEPQQAQHFKYGTATGTTLQVWNRNRHNAASMEPQQAQRCKYGTATGTELQVWNRNRHKAPSMEPQEAQSSKYGTATGRALQVPISNLQQKTIASKGYGRFWLWIGLALQE
jgi:hypothetical protein